MKKITGILVLAGLLSGFTSNPPATGLKELTGYKLVTNTISLTDYNLWVVTNKEVFCQTFSPENNTTTVPDFETEWVMAGKIKTVHNSYTLRFTSAAAVTDHLNVYFKIKRDNKENAADETVSMITVPKGSGIKRVNFYHDKVLVRTIPIVSVY